VDRDVDATVGDRAWIDFMKLESAHRCKWPILDQIAMRVDHLSRLLSDELGAVDLQWFACQAPNGCLDYLGAAGPSLKDMDDVNSE
jgi:hypothetical protein